MNKTEVIQAVAYCLAPNNACMAVRDSCGVDTEIIDIEAESLEDGLLMLACQADEARLTLRCRALPESPSPELFVEIHTYLLEMHTLICRFSVVCEELLVFEKEDFERQVGKLREIATELEIWYDAPCIDGIDGGWE
jgi:hypothetical protein